MNKIISTLALVTLTLTGPTFSAAAELDNGEATHLTFMREEEKLARDVYKTLQEIYPDVKVFVNIGDGSEQTHTDTVRDMLFNYNLPDPNPDANILPESIGVYTGLDYGWYFTEKYDLLVSWGSQSLLDGLYVGAFIEELDMLDIVGCPKVIVETDNGIDSGQCGLEYTDETALQNMYTHLLDGSKDHLRAYVANIEGIIGAGNYVAQVLPQAEVDAILGR